MSIVAGIEPSLIESITKPAPPRPRLWFTAKGERYVEAAEKYFFDSDDLPVLQEIEAHTPQILAEYEAVVGKDGIYRAYFQDGFAFPPATWDTIPLSVFGVKRPASRFFPELMRALDAHPQVIGAFFSRVKPNSQVLPHCGVTNAIYRCHMGIDLPSTDASVTGMQVGPEVTGWKIGKFFAFNDSNYHATWNRTDKERVILVVDLLRPEFERLEYYFYARILFSYFCLKIDELVRWKPYDRFLRSQFCKRWANVVSWPITPIAWAMVKASALYFRAANAPIRPPARANAAR